MKVLTLTINVSYDENVTDAVDALNETLNTLSREGVIDDSDDDAWAWTEVSA